MAGKYFDIVSQLKQSPQRRMKGPRTSLELAIINGFQGEVHTAYISNKKRVAGQHKPVVYDQAHVFRGVPWSVDHIDPPVTDPYLITISKWRELKRDVCGSTQVKTSPGGSGEGSRGGEVISMDVSVHHVGDFQPETVSDLQVLLNGRLRVDDGSDAVRRAADDIRSTRSAFMQHLAEQHIALPNS